MDLIKQMEENKKKKQEQEKKRLEEAQRLADKTKRTSKYEPKR